MLIANNTYLSLWVNYWTANEQCCRDVLQVPPHETTLNFPTLMQPLAMLGEKHDVLLCFVIRQIQYQAFKSEKYLRISGKLWDVTLSKQHCWVTHSWKVYVRVSKGQDNRQIDCIICTRIIQPRSCQQTSIYLSQGEGLEQRVRANPRIFPLAFSALTHTFTLSYSCRRGRLIGLLSLFHPTSIEDSCPDNTGLWMSSYWVVVCHINSDTHSSPKNMHLDTNDVPH